MAHWEISCNSLLLICITEFILRGGIRKRTNVDRASRSSIYICMPGWSCLDSLAQVITQSILFHEMREATGGG
jgi:hypothetical protein